MVWFLLSCGSDISIITTEKKNDDSAIIAEDTYDNYVSSEDTGYQNNNLNIGFAQIYFRQIACPQCVGSYGEFDISAKLNLYYPTSASNFDYMTDIDTCTTQLVESYVDSQPLPATQFVYFNNIELYPSGAGLWSANNLLEYQIQRQVPHSINTEYGNVNDAFISIEGFDDIQPYTLLWVDPSYAFDAAISKNGTNFSWFPVLPNDLFEIIIAVYSQDGSSFLGAVSCMSNDSGSMYIPGNYFLNYPTWSLAAVHLIRHRIGSTYSEELGGNLEYQMIWEVVGTGHIE